MTRHILRMMCDSVHRLRYLCAISERLDGQVLEAGQVDANIFPVTLPENIAIRSSACLKRDDDCYQITGDMRVPRFQAGPGASGLPSGHLWLACVR